MESTTQTRLADAAAGTVRLAGPADRNAIFALVNAAFVLERPLNKGGRERLAEDGELEMLMARGVFLVCEHKRTDQHKTNQDGTNQDGTLAASVYLEPGYGGRIGHCYLGMLAIDPARQRAGLGRRMMEAAEQYARSAGCFAVDLRVVSPRETKLVPLYDRLGYRVEGTEPYPEELAAKMVAPGHFICMTKPV